MMNNDIVLLQTTISNLNKALYKRVGPQSLLAWQRVRLANHMAANGSQWFDVVKRYNSGTYNNQYMVIDLTKVKVGKYVDDDALWVIEQMPGLVVGQDVTSILRNGYWASYNRPFFEEIVTLGGYQPIIQKYPIFSYDLAPRGKIFRRDAGQVADMKSMKRIMSYNDFRHDKYSGGKPTNTICARGDLDPDKPTSFGCTDIKVTDLEMARERRAFAINGPTTGTELGNFQWKDKFPDTFHWGTPEMFNFSFVEMTPTLI